MGKETAANSEVLTSRVERSMCTKMLKIKIKIIKIKMYSMEINTLFVESKGTMDKQIS